MAKAKRRLGGLHPVMWFHDWEDRILVESWIPVRFQPILFATYFIGILFVVFRRPTLPSMTAMAGSFTAYTWLVLALVCPPLLFVAWLMIRYGSGAATYRGYYLRFAADIGQTFSFAAFLTAALSDPTPETEDAYSIILLSAMLQFLVVLDVRDILKLILLERTSTAVQDFQDVSDAKQAAHVAHVKEILDARDAQDVADVESGRATVRDDISRLQGRADDSQTRESEWSQHRDHKADHETADDAGS